MSPICATGPSGRARGRTAAQRPSSGRRKGAVLILFAVLLAALLAILAFAIDIGLSVHHRATLQNAVDAAALAGADALERGRVNVNNQAVRAATRQYFQLNLPGMTPSVQLGRWNPVTRVFEPGLSSSLNVNAVQVTARWQYPSLFGRVLGHSSYRSDADAVAIGGRDVAGPRDIVLMIDQTPALLAPLSDPYAPGENAPNDYPLNAKRALKEAVAEFVQYLATNFPDDRIGISGFAHDTALETGLTNNASTLQTAFDIGRPNAMLFTYQDYLDTSGGRYPGTPPRLDVALDGASQGQIGGLQIATGTNSRPQAKKILVLISDGSTANSSDPLAVAAQLGANRFNLHTITVGAPSALMRQLVVGDGRSYLVPTPDVSAAVSYVDMRQAFRAAFDVIAGKEAPPAMLVR